MHALECQGFRKSWMGICWRTALNRMSLLIQMQRDNIIGCLQAGQMRTAVT
jgi:hypothetical protein